MNQFLKVIFGGLLAVTFGIAIGYGIVSFSRAGGFRSLGINISKLTSSARIAVSHPEDGTSISGIVRTIRFSAVEEEDPIRAATEALDSSNHTSNGITARAYIVKNLSTGDIVTESNPNRLLPIASLTKLVTAIVAGRMLDPDSRMTITREIMSSYGNTASFKVGETLRVSDLLYPLLMVSSNDAAEALAREYGRSKFIRAMNDFAQSIGAYRTYFADPSGLSSHNVSTVTDMSIILDWIRKNNPNILAITELKTKTVRSHTWVNPAHFLSWSNYLGGKNGYTPEANRTGAALFHMGNKKEVYSVVVLGSESRDDDVVRLLGKVVE